MKALKVISFVFLFVAVATVSMAQQTVTEKIPVSGNCGMCKSKIEKAAKSTGVNEASWDSEKKILTVSYISTSSNAAKIQQAVAAVGYDTRDVKATDEAYNKLHGCCKYDRSLGAGNKEKMDCCKEGKCTQEGHNGKDCCKKTEGQMDCCKDGKCSKPGHDGKDCCKPAASSSH